MALIKFIPSDCRGVTLMELLVASVLLSLVIGGSMAIYLSGVKFMAAARTDNRTYQAPNLKTITKYIDISHTATVANVVNGGAKQLTVVCDCDMETLTPQGAVPYNAADDETAVFVIDNATSSITMSLNGAAATTIISNVNFQTSSFSLIAPPAGQNNSTVVEMTIELTNPALTMRTRASLMGAASQ